MYPNSTDSNADLGVKAIAATSRGFAVFLGNREKAFVIFVDQSVGAAIVDVHRRHAEGTAADHDLVANVLQALGAKIEKAIVNDLKGALHSARRLRTACADS